MYVGFAAKDVNRQTLSTPDGDLTITTDSYYYDDSDEERSSVPTKLRYCYRYGAQKEIEFKSTAAWTVRYASIADVNADWGAVKGQIWMEEDGQEPALVELLSQAGLSEPEQRLVVLVPALDGESSAPRAVLEEMT